MKAYLKFLSVLFGAAVAAVGIAHAMPLTPKAPAVLWLVGFLSGFILRPFAERASAALYRVRNVSHA